MLFKLKLKKLIDEYTRHEKVPEYCVDVYICHTFKIEIEIDLLSNHNLKETVIDKYTRHEEVAEFCVLTCIYVTRLE